MYRKMESVIRQWLVDSRNAFLLTGARQTGKTWIIRHVLEDSDYHFAEFNFLRNPELVTILGETVSQDAFMMRLKALLPQECETGNTVIFFDEIQQTPELVTRIKFLVDEGSFRYILSGSLLGVTLKNIASAPVGYLTVAQMYPMDFDEFMIANGISDTVLTAVRESFENRVPMDDFIHEKLVSLFYVYLLVGGMPQAVDKFLETGDVRLVSRIHTDIMHLYKADFTKYETLDKRLKLISIYDLIPSELNKQNRRFVFTYLDKELKFDRYENSFLWLKDAGVALPVYNAEEPCRPLATSKSSNIFRLFGSDVGMLTSSYPDAVKMQVLQHQPDINNGALFENAVAQQLFANGYEPYFYKKKSIGEIDFLIERDGAVLPIEVKSGKEVHQHKALNHLLDSGCFQEAFVLSPENLQTDGRLIYVPVYMTYLIRDYEMSDTIIRLDLDGLRG